MRTCAIGALVIGGCLLAAPVDAGEGDLDPAFGDVGRAGPLIDFDGAAWSLLPRANDEVIFAGGRLACVDVYCDDIPPRLVATGFVNRLSGSGSLDSSFVGSGSALDQTQVLDVALQADGKIVAVGRQVTPIFSEGKQVADRSAFTVYRFARDGSLDPTFGAGGVVVPLATTGDSEHMATSVTLDPDGRIVVAGSRLDRNELVVLRLLANGVLDDSFGISGVFTGSRDSWHYFGPPTHVVRTASGGYRVMAERLVICLLIALTKDGVLDDMFGASGIVQLEVPSSTRVGCSSIAAQADDRLLVAGSADEGGFVTRLRTNGSHDASFATNVVASLMTGRPTSLAVGPKDSIFVAGHPAGRPRTDVAGALVVRLQANGELDAAFGSNGSTWIDLPSDHGADPTVHDLAVLPDGRVLAAGGDYGNRRPFVVRLLGDAGGDGPGVLGVVQSYVVVNEQSREAVVKVRRTGGESGDVSVAYQTAEGGPTPATGSEDFTQITGQLSWADGDTRDQEIRVPIAPDAGPPEKSEQFLVVLSDPDGGAGLGTRNAIVEILGDGDPQPNPGVVGFTSAAATAQEGHQIIFSVRRTNGSMGAVSVAFQTFDGTATAGSDYAAHVGYVDWGDGDTSDKTITISIADDTTNESDETFVVELSAPTGGAIIGSRSSATITIEASDQPSPPPPSGNSGGGDFGLLSLLLLGIARILNSAQLARRVATTAAVASSLLCPLARGGSGDLDPAFATSAEWVRLLPPLGRPGQFMQWKMAVLSSVAARSACHVRPTSLVAFCPGMLDSRRGAS